MMADVLAIALNSFWSFIGTVIILGILTKLVLGMLAIVVVGIRGHGNINIE